VWKFLSSRPDLPIPVADLGADQPVGSAVALLHQTSDDSIDIGPYIFLSSGADKRASGPFRSFAFSDNGSASATTTTGSTVTDGVTAYAPVQLNFVRTYDQGEPDANCGYATEAVFRGTVQPTSNYMAGEDGAPSKDGVVFFAGTRLSPPNTKFAPPTPLACGAGYVYPCRSQFDSILYALQVATGNPAYDLNSGTEDAYRIYRDSRIAAISIQADPLAGGGGSRLAVDEGLIKSVPKPPPPPGVPPQGTTSASGAVVLARVTGQPAPAVQWGSTVCQ
jgi:hypothetical protein